MRKIFKYPLDLVVKLPAANSLFYKVVKVDKQSGSPYLWIELSDINQEKKDYIFQIFGTGHTIPALAEHCGTFFDEPFVWHVYDTTNCN